jgi:hypothetical protein
MKNIMKMSSFPALGLALLLISTAEQWALAADNVTILSAAEIIKQTRAKYASLSSYRDEGTAVATLGTNLASGNAFTIKLARTNLYQIVWRQAGELHAPKGVVWSAGSGDFLWKGKGSKPEKAVSQEKALASATGSSGGAAASVPSIFFKMSMGNPMSMAAIAGTRSADDKVGDVDCYVVTHGVGGRTNTLWIGKADFLIRQIENDTSAAALKDLLEAQAKANPQIRALIEANGAQMFQDSKSVEMHQKIVINPPLIPADFNYQVPAESAP